MSIFGHLLSHGTFLPLVASPAKEEHTITKMKQGENYNVIQCWKTMIVKFTKCYTEELKHLDDDADDAAHLRLILIDNA